MSKTKTALAYALFIFVCLPQPAFCGPPKNVILFIGDGMSFEHVKAAGIYANGGEGTLVFESFSHQAQMSTHSADAAVTDSAAAATAIATGRKVNNGVVSIAAPGDGGELQTLAEYFKAKGKSTGLVTTTYITHATPACFGAHEPNRRNLAQIAEDYLTQTRPNVLFGAGGHAISPAAAKAAGYVVVTDARGLLGLDTENVDMVSGQFGRDIPYEYDGVGELPHLWQMTAVALGILDNNLDGFFLMIEGGKIDWAAHANDLERAVFETIEFARAVRQACDWAKGQPDTLIIVTADHETGGLKVTTNNGKGNFPSVAFSTDGHTAANVPIYAWGANAEMVAGILDNTDIFAIATTDRLAFPGRTDPARLILLVTGLAVLFVLAKVAAVKSRSPKPANAFDFCKTVEGN